MHSIVTPKPAWWLVGPPGSGKSYWVYNRAKKIGAKILRIHARIDRSFRDGRPLLFSIHRASEPTLVWIEGADVLTPEAQAFLRRIIETCSKHVEFVLETRDETRISLPIRSRCITIVFNEPSWRQKEYQQIIPKLPKKIRDSILNTQEKEKTWYEKAKLNPVKEIIIAREQSLNPAILLETVLKEKSIEEQYNFNRAWGSGRSIWSLLALALCD